MSSVPTSMEHRPPVRGSPGDVIVWPVTSTHDQFRHRDGTRKAPLDTRQVRHRKVSACRFANMWARESRPSSCIRPAPSITFDELEARANRLAHYFRHHGLREGDAVAILMENNEHIHAVMWAARRSGLYYVPINTHLTAAEAAYIIDNSGAKAIIGSAPLRKVCENLGEHLPAGLPDHALDRRRRMAGWQRYPECVADQPDTPIDDEIEGDLLQYSSGTTGRPKGIKRRPATRPAVGIARHDVGPGRLLAPPRRRVSEPGPAVPHRAVGVVDASAGRRHHHRSAGEVRRRGSARRASSATGSPMASSFR